MAVDAFELEWVRQVVQDALAMMQEDCIKRHRDAEWKLFSLRVVGPLIEDVEPVEYRELIEQLHLDTPRQAINLLATAKRTFLRHLQTAISRYAEDGQEVSAEIEDLRRIVGR